MKKATLLSVIVSLFVILLLGCTTTSEVGSNQIMDIEDIYLTFELRDDVTLKPVSYKNRFGITIAAHMYLPKDFDASKKYPALLIGTPYGGVKEQGAGIYAMNMAERGFISLAFDESYNGESGGLTRDVASPEIFVEDFSAGVDFLGTRSFVNRERIGVIGICGSGGFSLTAAQVDKRIKAVATTSMYDISSMNRDGFGYYMTKEMRDQQLEQLSTQRWTDFEIGKSAMPQGGWGKSPADTVPEGLPPIMEEFFTYYGMKRGWHPNTIDNFTLTSSMSFINFSLMNNLDEISPRPILFIMGENAHSRYYTEEAFDEAVEPKELIIIPGANHVDLYDREDVIPFDKLESFFTKYLK